MDKMFPHDFEFPEKSGVMCRYCPLHRISNIGDEKSEYCIFYKDSDSTNCPFYGGIASTNF